jgi:hypothetical protein
MEQRAGVGAHHVVGEDIGAAVSAGADVLARGMLTIADDVPLIFY